MKQLVIWLPFNPSLNAADGVVLPAAVSPLVEVGKSAKVFGMNSLRGLVAASFRLENKPELDLKAFAKFRPLVTCRAKFL